MAGNRPVSSLVIDVETLSGLRQSSSSVLEEAAVRLKNLKAHLCLGGGQGAQ